MPVILLAHRDPQLRASLGAALTARGFEVIGVDSVDTALDAAAAGATALLVEMQLLADEDLEVKTRLDLRSGRPTRILALTHKASAQEMSMLKRHGAGLLSRSVDDVERMAAMLRIQEEAPAPWDGPPPPVAKPASPSKPMAAVPPKAQPSNIVPPPAPRPPPPAMVAVAAPPSPAAAPPATSDRTEPRVAAPWDDEIELDTNPAPPTFKPAPAAFMPPDLSKSIAAAASEPKPAPPKPVPLPPPAMFTPPDLRKLAPPPPAPAVSVELDDAATAIGTPMLPADPAPPSVSGDGPLQVPADLFETPEHTPKSAPPPGVPSAAPPPLPASAPKPSTWSDDDEDLARAAPTFDTDVFRDEAEEPTNNVKAPPPPSDAIARAVAEALGDEEPGARTSVSPNKMAPRVEVEAEPGSTGTFAIPARSTDSLAAPKAAAPPLIFAPPPTAPPALQEEGTQVIPELAAAAIPAKPSADPFAVASTETVVPDISGIAANVSNAWFDDAASGVDKSVSGEGPVVLVVEDEPAFRVFLKEALSSQGYRVHTAINGPNALRFVKQTPNIDLVISDLHMPHMDGFELKHEIDQFLHRPMPFIVCTADANEEKIQVAAQVGAAALVPKPIENLDAFFAIITDTLKDAGVIARTA